MNESTISLLVFEDYLTEAGAAVILSHKNVENYRHPYKMDSNYNFGHQTKSGEET